MIFRFTVGSLSCAVVSDGQLAPPWEPPLAAFFTPAAGVSGRELEAAVAAEGQGRVAISCGYNCLLVRTSDGHAVLLHSGGEQLLCVGDLFYDQLQVSHPRWSTPWDHDRARAVRTRRRLLDRAADERLLVHAYHMPFPGLGTIARHGGVYRWEPRRP